MQDINTLLQTDAVLNQLAQQLLEAYKKQLEEQGTNASHTLANTATYEIAVVGSNTTTKHFQVLFNLQDYYIFVENGRKSGKFPPIDKIAEWIQVKPIIPHADSKGRIPSVKQLAFLISRKIANEGTQPQHVLAHALENANQIVDAMVNRISELIQKDIDRELVTVFGK